jgi:DNA-binding LacI/PurR family transcriptional regulator
VTKLAEKKSDLSNLRREPRHLTLVRDLHEQMRSGRLRPGDQLPSFNELRERWGVGRDTLERMYKVLERDGLITREHRRGVFVAHPGQAKKTGTIGFINHPRLLHHPYYMHLLRGVQREALAAGVEVLLLSDQNAVRWEKVDGVLYQTTMGGQLEMPPGVPRVCLIYAYGDIDSAVVDDYPGMVQALEHLLQLGHRRIAFLTLEMQPHSMSRQRIAAYQDALRSWGVEPQAAWMRCLHEPKKTGRPWEETGYDDMRQWLAEDWSTQGCTALLAHNDETAVGAVAALQEAGLRVPEEVSVVGFDGTEIAHYHRPRLTTVKVPLEEIGARGFELLMQQVNRPLRELGEQRPSARLSLPTEFQVGQSTAPSKQA